MIQLVIFGCLYAIKNKATLHIVGILIIHRNT